MRLIFLDSGPLGLISNPGGRPRALQCWQWAMDRLTSGALLSVPGIADSEIRRELIRAGATTGLKRPDWLRAGLIYAPPRRP